MDRELPAVTPAMVNSLDAAKVVQLLSKVAEPYQAALTLFYLEDCSYKEIAEILGIPLGTVQSRISRGMSQLQLLIHDTASSSSGGTRREETRG